MPTETPPTDVPYTFGTTTGAEGWVEDHNFFRCQHGADPVVWDSALASKAQAWADELESTGIFEHSDSYNLLPAAGENLAWGSGFFSCSTYIRGADILQASRGDVAAATWIFRGVRGDVAAATWIFRGIRGDAAAW